MVVRATPTGCSHDRRMPPGLHRACPARAQNQSHRRPAGGMNRRGHRQARPSFAGRAERRFRVEPIQAGPSPSTVPASDAVHPASPACSRSRPCRPRCSLARRASSALAVIAMIDGVAGSAFAPADFGGGGEAIHLRHLAVHEDDVVRPLVERVEQLEAIRDGCRRDTPGCEAVRGRPSGSPRLSSATRMRTARERPGLSAASAARAANAA